MRGRPPPHERTARKAVALQLRNNTMPDTIADFLESLGKDVARKCHWDKDDILTVCLQALSDANYHTEAMQIVELMDKPFE